MGNGNGNGGVETRPVAEKTEELARAVVDAAFKVHSTLGPGLLESVYEACLRRELERRGLRLRAQVSLPVVYDGMEVEAGFRLDLLVEETLIVEIKAVESPHPVHVAQVLTCLKLTGLRLGMLINFNVPLIRDGIRRVIR